MANTNRKGLDILLNCSTDMTNVNVIPIFKCLVNNGRYIEMYPNNVFIDKGAKYLDCNYTFERIQPDVLIVGSSALQNEVASLMREGQSIVQFFDSYEKNIEIKNEINNK